MPLRLETITDNTEGPTPPHGFRAWTDIGRNLHIDWLVKNVIERESLVLIYGPSGSGKTFLTFDLMASVARGVPFCGHKTYKDTVLYVAAEGGKSGDRRKLAYAQHHALSTPIPFYQADTSPNLLEAKDVTEFIQKAQAIKPNLIAIDTLNRATPGGDENASRDMGQAIRAADTIRRETGACVVLVHHTGKNLDNGPRGHSSLFAACDTVIEVDPSGGGKVARITKARDGEQGREMPFRLEVVNLGDDDDGDPITSCVIEPADKSAIAKSKRAKLPDLARNLLEAIEMAAMEAPATLPERAGTVPFRQGTPCTTKDAVKRYAEQLGVLDRSSPEGTYRSRMSKGFDRLKALKIIEVWGDVVCIIDRA